MLILFEIENFRSFSVKQTFHLIERNYKRFPNHIYKFNEKLSLLKTSAIYGANASGKTNIFKALSFVKKMVEDNTYLKGIDSNKILKHFKLDDDYLNRTSNFKIEFINDSTVYIYIIKIHSSSKKIAFESLSCLNKENEAEIIFERKLNSSNKTELSFYEPRSKEVNTVFYRELLDRNTHSTLLSFSDFIASDHMSNAHDWFKNKVRFLFPAYKLKDIAYILSLKPEYLKLANRIVEFANLGISRLDIQKVPLHIYFGKEDEDTIRHIENALELEDNYTFEDARGNSCTAVREDEDINILKLVSIHLDKKSKEIPFELDEESRGTVVFLHLLPALILCYGEGVNYFIDEISNSLHPILLREIVKQFLTNNIGESEGQLIFNSHEDFILDEKIMRQDELWLIEKNKFGSSEIFPLSNKSIRFDLNLKKNYLNGKLGGVPFDKEPPNLFFNEDLK